MAFAELNRLLNFNYKERQTTFKEKLRKADSFTMLIRFIFSLILIFPTWASASSYDSYKLKEMGQSFMLKIQNAVKGLELIPVNSPDSGGIELFGVNQIFVNNNFSKILIFKHNVLGKITLNNWEDVGTGKVYHYQSDGKINAVFINGLNEKSVQPLIDKIREIKVTKSFIDFSLISKAAAEDCNIQNLPIQNFSALQRVSESMIFQSLLSCGSGMKSGAYDATAGSGIMVWNGLKSIAETTGEVFTDPKKKLGEFYGGVVKGAMVVKDIYMFAAKTMTDPAEAAAILKNKYGESSEKIISIFDQLKNLPPEIKIEMGCSLITGVGIDVLIAYLTAGGGAAKLILTFERVSKQASVIGKIFASMNKLYQTGEKGLKLTSDKMASLTRKILKNEIDESDLAMLNTRLSRNEKGSQEATLNGLACFL